MEQVTIYHNPKCSTSRQVLALIREAGIEPEVVLYLQNPPDRARLKALAQASGQGVRGLLRGKEALAKELRLDESHWTDEQLLDFMGQHPVLINRPIVSSPKGTRLCRPVETVQDLL